MPQSTLSGRLFDQPGTCTVRSVNVYDWLRLGAHGTTLDARELDTIFWDKELGPRTDLTVAVEVETQQLDRWAQVTLDVMSGEGEYDVAWASASFQFLKMKALVLFTFNGLEFGPPAWGRANGFSHLTFRVRPGLFAPAFDRRLPATVEEPKRPRRGGWVEVLSVEKTPRQALNEPARQVVVYQHRNPLGKYRRPVEFKTEE